MTTFSLRFQIAGHSAIDWTTGDPVLLDREFAWERDTGRLKFGNGASNWSALPYWGPFWDDITGKPTDLAGYDITPADVRDTVSGGDIANMVSVGFTGGWYIFASGTTLRFYNGGDFATLSPSGGWATSITTTDALYKAIRTITASGSVATTDSTILCDASSGALTLNLPGASAANKRVLHIKKVDASGNAVTIDANGSETIDGAMTTALSAQWESVTLQSDGSAWFILG